MSDDEQTPFQMPLLVRSTDAYDVLVCRECDCWIVGGPKPRRLECPVCGSQDIEKKEQS